MPRIGLNQRFLDSTRGQILSLLRCEPRTVEELATAAGLTDNAVRAHLVTLERDGMVRQAGTRRGEGAGKPATLYEVPPGAEAALSHAYAPVLELLLEEIVGQLPPDRAKALLTRAGRRLADELVPAPKSGPQARLEAAVALLNGLGGAASIEKRRGVTVIQGCGCPLSTVVARRPEMCHAVTALVAEVVGGKVRQCCQHGDRPSCCFEVVPAA